MEFLKIYRLADSSEQCHRPVTYVPALINQQATLLTEELTRRDKALSSQLDCPGTHKLVDQECRLGGTLSSDAVECLHYAIRR